MSIGLTFLGTSSGVPTRAKRRRQAAATAHHETLTDLPPELVGPLFGAARRLVAAVESATGAVGARAALREDCHRS